jgi:excisionase family DNA binding protein
VTEQLFKGAIQMGPLMAVAVAYNAMLGSGPISRQTIDDSPHRLIESPDSRVRENGRSIIENSGKLLSYKEAARFLSISEPYLRRLKQKGKIPFVSISRRGVRFKLSSLNSWVEKREIV